ncbi:hypothetical protein WME94_54990 [Sorangium sp. So ce429]
MDEYYALQPRKYSRLDALLVQQLRQAEGGEKLSLRLVLCELDDGNECLVLSFDGVRELVFEQSSYSVTQIVQLDIRDMSEMGWERIYFAVSDSENEVISFKCHWFCGHVCVESNCPDFHATCGRDRQCVDD